MVTSQYDNMTENQRTYACPTTIRPQHDKKNGPPRCFRQEVVPVAGIAIVARVDDNIKNVKETQSNSLVSARKCYHIPILS